MNEKDMEKVMKAFENKLPKDKLMAVPIFLLMIDIDTWTFPDAFKEEGFREIVDFIENSEELKAMFQRKRDKEGSA